MSRIRVWTSEGKWSDEIRGLDKVYLMKTAILKQCCLTNEVDASESLEGFEIDYRWVADALWQLDDSDYYIDNIVDHEKDERFIRLVNKQTPFKDAKFFIIPLAVLKEMQKDDPSLAAKYEQIINASKAPSPAPKGYCLMLRFENE